MTLLEAFQELAPVPADLPSEVRTRREQAAVHIWDALRRVARRALPGHQDADAFVSNVAMRLLLNGPRGTQMTGPTSDAAVEAYLYTSLRNQWRDLQRKTRGHHSLDDDEPGRLLQIEVDHRSASPFADALELVAAEQGEALMADATRVLYEHALPAVAGTHRDAQGFALTVRDVRDLTREAITIEAIVAREGLPPGSTSHNRLYKRHQRTRTRFLDGLTAWLATEALPPHLDLAVRRVAQHDMTARVVRGVHAS